MSKLRLRIVPPLTILLLGAILTGCAGASVSRTTYPTRTTTLGGNATQASVTQQSTSVSVTVSAREQGAIADGNARLSIQVVLTNNAGKPIEIIYPCGSDPIQFTVRDSATHTYVSGSDSYSCPPSPSRLYPPAIAVGTAHTYPLSDDLSHATLAPGQYIVDVTLSWQGAQDAAAPPAPNPVVYGTATQRITVTLR